MRRRGVNLLFRPRSLLVCVMLAAAPHERGKELQPSELSLCTNHRAVTPLCTACGVPWFGCKYYVATSPSFANSSNVLFESDGTAGKRIITTCRESATLKASVTGLEPGVRCAHCCERQSKHPLAHAPGSLYSPPPSPPSHPSAVHSFPIQVLL